MNEKVRRTEHANAHSDEEHEKIEAQNILDTINEDLTLGAKYLSAGQVSMADFLIHRARETYTNMSDTHVDPEKYAAAGATLDHLIQELNTAQKTELD